MTQKQKIYTIQHETTGHTVEVVANRIDSETHKYQWCFWEITESGEELLCAYSQRWNIVNIDVYSVES